METKELLNLIAQTISDKKGFNILALKIDKLSAMSEYLILADGFVDRHLSAMASAIEGELKKLKIYPLKTEEGKSWVVMDFGNIMIHLFMPEARQTYQLEKVWSKAETVSLKIEAEPDQTTKEQI